ncbi:interleukin-17 receptor E-like protein [Pelodytes ibericus]
MQLFKKTYCLVYWEMAKSHIFLLFIFGISNCHSIEKIKECGLTCSPGVHCKSKDIFSFFCRNPPHSLLPTVLENLKISTVMKCKHKNHCSLYLNVNGTVTLDDKVHGVEICSMTLSTQQNKCTSVRFVKSKTEVSGVKKVNVQFNCFEVSVGQHVYVSMRTIPHFCNFELEKEYHVEDCDNPILGNSIPSCLTGKLDYMVNEENKTITVHVSNNLEEYDYNVRLCLKHYSCQDISGAYGLIKMENSSKSVTLPYMEILPCLCIEGWSAFTDSRRIRLCPFKNETQTLWDRIVYNPISGVLSWEPSCPVQVTVSLCWLADQDDQCINIQKSTTTTLYDQVSYTHVDTHPGLCMKFTTEMGSWVRCPFSFGQFPGWDMNIFVTDELLEIRIVSQAKAKFSVVVCNKTKLDECDPLHPLHVFTLTHWGASGYATINMTRDICGPNVCIQGLRSDVNYSFPVQICNIPCKYQTKHYDTLNILIMSAGFLISVTIITFFGFITLKVYYQRKLQQEGFLKKKVKHLSAEIGFY